jgi:hypothetical protein
MDDYDTDAAGILIGEGVDVPTALAASYRPPATDQPARLNPAGVIAALIVTLIGAWLLLS